MFIAHRPRPALYALCGILISALLATTLSSRLAEAQSTPPIASTLVATEEMLAVPTDRRWVVRGEHAVNAEHSHSGGFVFVQRGSAELQIDGETIPVREGEGLWVPEGVPHTHRASASDQLLTVTLETAAQVSAAPALLVSDSLGNVGSGPHLARMTADQYQVGASTPPHRHFGPEVVFVRNGSYELSSAGSTRQFNSGQGYTMDPQVPHRLRNAGTDAARLFNISLVPLGRQTGETLQADALSR